MMRISYIYMVTFLHTQYTVAISLEMRIQTKSHSCASLHHILAVEVSATMCGVLYSNCKRKMGRKLTKNVELHNILNTLILSYSSII
jgi:hypothetical protein